MYATIRHHEHDAMRAAAMRLDRARQTAEYLDRRASAIRTVGTRAAAMTVQNLRDAGGLTKMLLAALGLPPCDTDVDSALYTDIAEMRLAAQKRTRM